MHFHLKKVSGQSELQSVYVLLFTCCSARAVHLELATDLSVDVFVRCLRGFTARRGLPELIFSDNANTFKAADKLRKSYFLTQESGNSWPVKELTGDLMWTERPGGVAFLSD